MANPDRLSGLDASFLSLERSGAHMHVGSVLVFEGEAPPYTEVVEHLERRLHLVPRYRQKLAWPPMAQSRPQWIDDPHFNARYHVRHTALPAPAGEEQLKRLAGRVFAQGLDRSKPLWELWLVDRVGADSFAVISKTHHALVDGVSGVANVIAERAAIPLDALRGLYGAARRPERVVSGGGKAVKGLASTATAGLAGAPSSPLNVRIGPHRRFTWVEADLAQFKAIKS